MSTAVAETHLLPKEVAEAYFDDQSTLTVEQLRGGELNTTLQVTSNVEGRDRTLIIQHMSPVFGRLAVKDMLEVTTELERQGWDVPLVVPTNSGELTVSEETEDGASRMWRAMTFIDAEEIPPAEERTAETYVALGENLARLHGSLATIDYEPQFRIPHFQETDYHLGRLERDWLAAMPDSEAYETAKEIVDNFAGLPVIPKGVDKEQLIHGDPRTGNQLAKDGMPYTYIDWDTIMKDSIWIDVGDFMRSLAEDAVQAGKPVPIDDLRHVAEGYRQVAMPDANKDEFFGWAMTATMRVALTLSSRYANDIVDGEEYFGWDETRFASRRDNHMARIATQMTILNGLKSAAPAEGVARV